jgi:uncharacterized protein YggT (Ycf19 family)
MSIEHKERVAVVRDDGYERREKISEIAPSRGTTFVSRVIQIIGFFVTVIVLLIVIRFLLQLLGANEANAFADLIFRLSNPLILPFAGLFPNTQSGNMVLEWSSVAASIFYLLLGWLLTSLIRIIFGSNRAIRHTRTIERSDGS